MEPPSSQNTAATQAQRRPTLSSFLRANLPALAGLAIIAAFLALTVGSEPRARVLASRIHEIEPYRFQLPNAKFLHLQALRVVASNGIIAFVGLALVAIVVLWERRPLTSIGLIKPTRRDLASGLGGWILVTAVNVALYAVGYPGEDPRLTALIMAMPLYARAIEIGTAFVFEEIIERGFLIERVEALTGRTWIAFAASCFVMSLYHAGWGWSGVVAVAPSSVIYAGMYVWRRNLPACMLMHFLQDSPLLWAPPLMRSLYR
jgi:CAAX protease family protein